MIKPASRKERQKRRHIRIRKKIVGTAVRPRVVVYKSNRYIFLQAVDDMAGKVLFSLSTLKYREKEGPCTYKNKEKAARLGEDFARIAQEKGLQRIVFDRNGYPYHGKIKALAEAMRKGGLAF